MNRLLPVSIVCAASMLLASCGGAARAPVDPASSAGVATTDGQAIELGRSFEIASGVMGETRRVNVYTPPGYLESGAAYPVLYLIDGGVDQDFLHIAPLSFHAWMSGSFREMIVVGIETVDRRRELAHRAVSDASLAADYPTHGESALLRRFIADEVKPWVEQRYRTDGYDVLIGESLAGLFVVETLLRAPVMFDAYVAVDPSLWWDDGALAKDAQGLLATHAGGERMLFLAVANEGPGMRAGQDALAAAVKAVAVPGLAMVYRPMEDERHSTIYHRAALEALRVVFALSTAPAQ